MPLNGLLALSALLACNPDSDGEGTPDADCPEADGGGTTTFFVDADGDGEGGEETTEACTAPSGYVATSTDCDDSDATVGLDAPEVCDGVDNDCDGAVDDGDDDLEGSPFYADADGDGFGDADSSLQACAAPDGYAENPDDCDDDDGGVSPDAPEVCDGVDNDCDGAVDDDDDDDDDLDPSGWSAWYPDGDGDGYGQQEGGVQQCAAPDGYIGDASDCDDSDAAVNPGATEICDDGLDNDCSGDAPECGIAPGSYSTSDAAYAYTGANYGDRVGQSLAVLDQDGDGVDELVSGAWGNDDVAPEAGAIYVYDALTASGGVEATASAILTGSAQDDYVGYVLANAGDVDGDGDEELLVGGMASDGGRGKAFLVYGATSALVDGELADVSEVFYGSNEWDYVGIGVSGLGDMNGDGYDDFALGAYGDDDNGAHSGSIWIHYGTASGVAGGGTDSADAQLYGPGSSAYLGFADTFSGLGDLDGDGAADAGFGAYESANSYFGAAYVYYGGTSVSGAASVATSADAEITGSAASSDFGRTVDGGDVTGDGYSDLLVWEAEGASGAGALYVFAGGTSRWSGAYSTADAAYSWTGDADGDAFGRAPAIGDLNGDGNADLLVGAGYDSTASSNAGVTFLVYGPMTHGGDSTDTDVQIYGASSGDVVGYFGHASGDLDGDGTDDLVTSALGWNSSSGQVLVFPGVGM